MAKEEVSGDVAIGFKRQEVFKRLEFDSVMWYGTCRLNSELLECIQECKRFQNTSNGQRTTHRHETSATMLI